MCDVNLIDLAQDNEIFIEKNGIEKNPVLDTG